MDHARSRCLLFARIDRFHLLNPRFEIEQMLQSSSFTPFKMFERHVVSL